MNFYKRHLGDIAKSCGDLSQGQMGAYDLLLDWHYANEKPLPLAADKVYRIGRAVTKAERDNVDLVLTELFTQTADGYTHKRAAEEMAKANAQAETNRRIAEEREALKRATKEARIVHEACNETETNITTNRQPSQTPDSRLQKEQELQGGSAAAEPPKPTRLDPIPYQEIVDAFNERLTGLAKVRSLTNPRKTAIRSAWNALPPEHRKIGAMKAIFAECQMDDFLNGTGPYSGEHANWRPDFDHVIKLKTVTKVYEKAMARRDRMRQAQAQNQTGAAA